MATGLTAIDGAHAGLAFCLSLLLFSLVVLDGFHPPPGCELQFVHELFECLTQVPKLPPFLCHRDIQLTH